MSKNSARTTGDSPPWYLASTAIASSLRPCAISQRGDSGSSSRTSTATTPGIAACTAVGTLQASALCRCRLLQTQHQLAPAGGGGKGGSGRDIRADGRTDGAYRWILGTRTRCRDPPASRGAPGARSRRRRPGPHRRRSRPRSRARSGRPGIGPLRDVSGRKEEKGKEKKKKKEEKKEPRRTGVGGGLDRGPDADNHTPDKHGRPPAVPVGEPGNDRECGNAAQLSKPVSAVSGWAGGGDICTYVVYNENEAGGRPFAGHAERRLVLLHVVDGTPIYRKTCTHSNQPADPQSPRSRSRLT